MTVLLLTPSIASAGGIQRYSAILIRAFRDLLGEGQVHCLMFREASNKPGSRVTTLSKLRYLWQAVCQSSRCRPDLIVCTHLALGPIGWLLAKLGGGSYWIVAHGIEAWIVLPRLKRAALIRANRIIVTSIFTREQLRKRQRIPVERLSSLPCTLDEALLQVEPEDYDVLASLGRDRRVVLTVSRMMVSERYKGHDVVLRALPSVLSRVPHLAYVIVGDGDDRVRLERLAEDLGLGEHVFFTGSVSDARLAALYRRSEIFVLPARTVVDDRDSKGEGFGIVFLEAMAFGKPAIGPNYGAPLELIRHGSNGLLVDPEDSASVAQALIELLENPDAARKMGEVGRSFMRKAYSYGAFHDQLKTILAVSEALTVKA